MAMGLPRDVGPVHFVGIGGIGMSGIAEIMRILGYQVQGSDVVSSPNVERLRLQGIDVSIGHGAHTLGDAKIVVVSSAIKPDNPEILEAHRRGLPIVPRAEMLGELMRFKSAIAVGGTHGKTTTTSLIGTLLEGAGWDPTVINGGIITAYGTNVRHGKGEWSVVESDESDGSFTKLPADVVVVTNIDPEHLEHYGSFEAMRAAYGTFIENIPFYGFAVLCRDHREVRALASKITTRRIVTYGTDEEADFRLVDWHYGDGKSTFRVLARGYPAMEFSLPMPGIHNALNATAAVAVACGIGVDPASLGPSLSSFSGVKRRFTCVGRFQGALVYDDYAHHPVEISAVFDAARGVLEPGGRVIAVVQPHRYTRLSGLFDSFCACLQGADRVVLAPVYAAGEAPISGYTHETLADAVRALGHEDVRTIGGEEDLIPVLKTMVEPGDCVLFLGAGSITAWAHAVPQAGA